MVEFPQTTSNLTEASTNLYELIKGRKLTIYFDNEVRLAVNRAVALEVTRGWRIAKEKASHKIDVVVALAMAALGAVQQGQQSVGFDHEFQARAARVLANAPRGPSWMREGSGSGRLYGSCVEDDAREDLENEIARFKPRRGTY